MPPFPSTVLIRFWEQAEATWHTQGLCVRVCVPSTAAGDSLTRCPGIVEANPRKFNLDATELGIRKAFITSTRQVVRVRSLAWGSGPGEGRGGVGG